jgi:hypothetical protein
VRVPARLHLPDIDRRSLLLGTALASTLLTGVLCAPSAALAFPPGVPCSTPGPTQIFEYSNTSPIVCVNTDTRIGDPFAINLYTVGDGLFIDLNNGGTLHSTALGIVTNTSGYQAGIHIVNQRRHHGFFHRAAHWDRCVHAL